VGRNAARNFFDGYVCISLVPSVIENQNFQKSKNAKTKKSENRQNQKSELSKIANVKKNFPLKTTERTAISLMTAKVRGAQTQQIFGSSKCDMLYPLGDHLCFPFNVALYPSNHYPVSCP
jgi:hypothetical protein